MTVRYADGVSDEPLEIIRINECESQLGSLCTKRYRRLWNEIVDLREQLAKRDTELVKDLRYALQCCEDHGLHIGELKRAIPQVEALVAKRRNDAS